ncbi:MAG: hypothetical protein R2750_05050 [Bacteroidales bacterium]
MEDTGFQSSYDRDEQGNNPFGKPRCCRTIITYIGYFLMSLGMFLTIFNKNSRFKSLIRMSTKLRESRKSALTVLVMAGIFFSGINSIYAASDKLPEIKKEHAEAFGKLIVQDRDGRLKPVNTLSSEVLRKLARKIHMKV